MTPAWVGAAWAVGGYLAGSLPWTYLVARVRGATEALDRARRDRSERDAHILLATHVGAGWAAAAAALDVAAALAYALLARDLGALSPGWLAASGVAVVVGHCWPPWARRLGGRGLAGAAGVLLGLLPVEMAVAGALILAGIAGRVTGPASTLGLTSVPAVAALRGQPTALVLMAAAVAALVVLRRLEGVSEVARSGAGWVRALYARSVWDRDRPGRP
jgi:glycerol-3-phosphate acyltransferase PlsY